MALLLLAVPAIVLGLILSRETSTTRRVRGWEAQAVGVALLAIAWLVASGPRRSPGCSGGAFHTGH